jgi:hypothetical protein
MCAGSTRVVLRDHLVDRVDRVDHGPAAVPGSIMRRVIWIPPPSRSQLSRR